MDVSDFVLNASLENQRAMHRYEGLEMTTKKSKPSKATLNQMLQDGLIRRNPAKVAAPERAAETRKRNEAQRQSEQQRELERRRRERRAAFQRKRDASKSEPHAYRGTMGLKGSREPAWSPTENAQSSSANVKRPQKVTSPTPNTRAQAAIKPAETPPPVEVMTVKERNARAAAARKTLPTPTSVASKTKSKKPELAPSMTPFALSAFTSRTILGAASPSSKLARTSETRSPSTTKSSELGASSETLPSTATSDSSCQQKRPSKRPRESDDHKPYEPEYKRYKAMDLTSSMRGTAMKLFPPRELSHPAVNKSVTAQPAPKPTVAAEHSTPKRPGQKRRSEEEARSPLPSPELSSNEQSTLEKPTKKISLADYLARKKAT
ncbi:MAG: hypothetical protein Q9227_000840 [Pyrenula ochraceoflavens]